jgi:hypothetical protein
MVFFRKFPNSHILLLKIPKFHIVCPVNSSINIIHKRARKIQKLMRAFETRYFDNFSFHRTSVEPLAQPFSENDVFLSDDDL